MTPARGRRSAVGAEPTATGGVEFRLWAPDHATMEVVVDGVATAMTREADGHFSITVAAAPGARYGFRVSGDERVYPDPASRWLPDGPDGLSAVVDLDDFAWHDAGWPGATLAGQVLYELHVGTFTAEGTWRAAAARLAELAAIGVTTIQMMPVAEFAGTFGWGYDGVQWFAPHHAYGAPRDLQHFVDTAHGLGLGVILDVVYNHLGPSGNYLRVFDRRWQSTKHANEWGEALNYDGEGAEGVRELVLENVRYWIRHFHIDGFRIDAAQQVLDDSAEHILAALTAAARLAAAPRAILVLAEHEGQDARLMRPADADGYGLDGIYNEDFHHACRVALTGVRDAYFSDYHGTSREWLAAALWGFLYQGQYYPWQKQRRGQPALDRRPEQFICFLENHDQVANGAGSRRLVDLTSTAAWRALSALLLLGPWTPLLFQGQERGCRRPFHYFADHAADLQQAVARGRQTFLTQFSRVAGAHAGPDDVGRVAFSASRPSQLDDDRSGDEALATLYGDLLALRRDDSSIAGPHARLMGATAGDRTLLLRYVATTGDRLIAVNLDGDLDLAALPEPLLAPPAGHEWHAAWCSDAPAYGGAGAATATVERQLMATGRATTLYVPRPLVKR